DREVVLAFAGLGDAAIVVGERMARIERDRHVEVADRAIEIELRLIGGAAVVVDIGVPGIEIDRGAIVADRLVVIALVEIFEPAIEIGDGERAGIIGAGLDDGAAGPKTRFAPELLAIMPLIGTAGERGHRQPDENYACKPEP